MRKLLVFAAVVAMSACTVHEERVPQQVVIVEASCPSKEIGVQDCRTVVEFPNGARRRSSGLWGQVGDTFSARVCRDAPQAFCAPYAEDGHE